MEDYCSSEVAKLLKEKGFDWECISYYVDDEPDDVKYSFCGETNSIWESRCCSAPTLQMAMKWLREVHHWHIFAIPKWEDVEYMPGEWEEKMVGYQYIIMDVGEVTRKNEYPTTTAFSPESACEAAIKYCLENLI